MVRAVLGWLLFFAADVALLWSGGAFSSEFGGYPDEPSHFVTGLMVRDYIATGMPALPMRFAETYYLHYPKVALGHYPPLYYVAEAAWMLLFPVTRTSILLFQAVLVALAASLLSSVVRTEFGGLAGIGAGILFVALPLVQQFTSMVMAEALVVPLILGAAHYYGRYLDTGRWAYSAWFGFLAALAILTKQVAVFLALLPLVAILLGRRFCLLRRPSFWLPALIVLVVAAPWYVFAHSYFAVAIKTLAAAGTPTQTFFAQLAELREANGIALLMAAAAGLCVKVLWPVLRRRSIGGTWISFAAVMVSFYLLRLAVPAADESRHLLSIEPAILMFGVAGVVWLAGRLWFVPLGAGTRALLVGLGVAAAFAIETYEIRPHRYLGFSEAAARLAADPEFRNAALLVCSDASGEGSLIAEVAIREIRPGHFVLRASKMLADTNWSGSRYEALYHKPEDVQRYLESLPVGVLIVESPPRRLDREDLRLVEEMLQRYPERWKLIGSYPAKVAASPPGREVRAYRLVGRESRPPGKIRINVERRLGRFVEN